MTEKNEFFKTINQATNDRVQKFRKKCENKDINEIIYKELRYLFKKMGIVFLRFHFFQNCIYDIEKHPEKYNNFDNINELNEKTNMVCAYVNETLFSFEKLAECVPECRKNKERLSQN